MKMASVEEKMEAVAFCVFYAAAASLPPPRKKTGENHEKNQKHGGSAILRF
jgi:hypothetical protein